MTNTKAVEAVENAIRRRLSLTDAGFGSGNVYVDLANDAIAAYNDVLVERILKEYSRNQYMRISEAIAVIRGEAK